MNGAWKAEAAAQVAAAAFGRPLIHVGGLKTVGHRFESDRWIHFSAYPCGL